MVIGRKTSGTGEMIWVWATFMLNGGDEMLKRRIAVLCMLLALVLGATPAFADSTVQASEELIALVDWTNEAIEVAIETAVAASEIVTKAYDAGFITKDQADDAYAKIIDVLKDVEEKLIDNVMDAAKEEGVKLICVYEEVQIGWYTVLIDPIIVSGNAD